MLITLRSLLLALLVCSQVYTAAGRQTPSNPIVDLGYATYKGVFNHTSNITSFLGVRFAAPPIGQLRFQAPAPPLNERPLGVQNADTLPTGCLQANFGQSATTPFRLGNTSRLHPLNKRYSNSEDCLFLNVWLPGPIESNAKLPVLVYIHGGGYEFGNITNTLGSDLVREAGGGLIAITLDYRLGIFGFLAGEEVKKKGALNAGILDQQAAFHWIQKYIHLFGGDSQKVTIWGESSGAGSVLQHMVAHGGNTQPPLFKSAMTSSTYLSSQYEYNHPILEKVYSDVTQMVGCTNASDTFQCLVGTDQATLQQANVATSVLGFYAAIVSSPCIDGDLIQNSPTQQISSGKLNGERFLAVTNTFEGTRFINPNISTNMTPSDYASQLFPTFTAEQSNAIAMIYENISTLATNIDKAGAIKGESSFICPTYLVLQSFKGAVYKGEFALPPGLHEIDVQYYFPNGQTLPYPNANFAASFAGAFVAFAKSGDPNVHPVPEVITPQWNTYNNSHTEMLFNRTEHFQPDIRAITTDPALLKRCDFWKTLFRATGQ